MFLEIGDTCYTLFNMVIYETNDKEKEKKENISYLSLISCHSTLRKWGGTWPPVFGKSK